MPREIAIHGVYVPTLAPLFMITTTLTWGPDQIFASLGLYRFT